MLLAIGAAGAAATTIAVATRDPDGLLAIAFAVGGAAIATGALVAAALAIPASRRHGKARRLGTLRAVRRGAVAGSIVGLIAVLRVIDGLTPLTAAFVVGAFVAAEVVLSARAT